MEEQCQWATLQDTIFYQSQRPLEWPRRVCDSTPKHVAEYHGGEYQLCEFHWQLWNT